MHCHVPSSAQPTRPARPCDEADASLVARLSGGPYGPDCVAHAFVAVAALPSTAAPAPAAPAAHLRAAGHHYLVTGAPEAPGETTAAAYMAMLWHQRAAVAVALVAAPWWPRRGARQLGDVTVTHVRSWSPLAVPALPENVLAARSNGPPGTWPALVDMALPTAGAARATSAVVEVLDVTLDRAGGPGPRPLRVVMFRGWPDFAAVHAATLASLVGLTAGCPPDQPLAVHCLGGRGRTGTFVLAHALAADLRAAPRGSPWTRALALWLALRRGRPGLVESPAQLYVAVAAGILAARHSGGGCDPGAARSG